MAEPEECRHPNSDCDARLLHPDSLRYCGQYDSLSQDTLRIVLDTNVLLAAVLSDQGASRQILQEGLDGSYIGLCSVALMLEYESVLNRPEHLLDSGLSESDVETLPDGASRAIQPVKFSYLWRPMLKDPNDEMILETAVNGEADLVVTMNLRHLEAGLNRFGIEALGPGPALTKIRKRR